MARRAPLPNQLRVALCGNKRLNLLVGRPPQNRLRTPLAIAPEF